MKSKLWIWIGITIVVIVIILLAFNWKKWFGKDDDEKGTGSSVINSINAQAIADRLYKLMEGLTLTPSSRNEVESTLKQVSESSDNNFKAVWNAFGKKEGDNLAEWADDETYVDETLAKSLKDRAIQLGLS